MEIKWNGKKRNGKMKWKKWNGKNEMEKNQNKMENKIKWKNNETN